jgi:hypothetical protein
MYLLQKYKKITATLLTTTILSTALITITPEKAEGLTPVGVIVGSIGAGVSVAFGVTALIFSLMAQGEEDLNKRESLSATSQSMFKFSGALIAFAGLVFTATGDEQQEQFKTKHHSSIKTYFTYSEHKKNKANKTKYSLVNLSNLMAMNDDYKIGGVLLYAKQDVVTNENKTNHQRLGLGVSLQGDLSDKLSFNSYARISNGSADTKWIFKELISLKDLNIQATKEDFTFKGKQKVSKIIMDNTLSYKIPVNETVTLIPIINLKLTRTFASDYYAYNTSRDVITLNQKPNTVISSDFMLRINKILTQNDSMTLSGGLVGGVVQEIYKYGKATKSSLRANTGEDFNFLLPFDKKKTTMWQTGVSMQSIARSGLYEISTQYTYGEDKVEKHHQGQLTFKINF